MNTETTMNDSGKRRLLVLGDSPGLTSGFACVVRNLVRRWMPWFGGPKNVELWGIGHAGWPFPPHSEWRPYTIYPGEYPWNTPAHFQDFLAVLRAAKTRGEPFTHLWMVQDTFQFNMGDFPEALRKIADDCGTKIFYYVPVDAPLDPEWTRMVSAAHQAVAYTEYGRTELWRALAEHKAKCDVLAGAGQTVPKVFEHPPVRVLPHGVDTSVFHPLPDRAALRKAFYGDWAAGHFVLLNVNSHQRRKGIVQSFQILQVLKAAGVRCRLHLHMPRRNTDEDTDLGRIAAQLDVNPMDWTDSDSVFRANASAHSKMTEAELNKLYNAADVVLSTTLGEGWGLSLTEGLAAGCPVAAPAHTSIPSIGDELRRLGMGDAWWELPVSPVGQVATGDSSRVRYPVDVTAAAAVLAERLTQGRQFTLADRAHGLNDAVRHWLDWDRIAAEWIKLFAGTP